jgi:hypothetical protein
VQVAVEVLVVMQAPAGPVGGILIHKVVMVLAVLAEVAHMGHRVVKTAREAEEVWDDMVKDLMVPAAYIHLVVLLEVLKEVAVQGGLVD